MLILASHSTTRRRMLENAGLKFTVKSPEIDERAIEATVAASGLGNEDVSQLLAETKAALVSEQHPQAHVIGADQALVLEGEVLHKVSTMEDARRRLLKLSGKTHFLYSSVAIAHEGNSIWRHTSVCEMTMRELSPQFIGKHLAETGDKVLSSVGAYQVEKEGIQLFEKIEGDFFAILGMPLLPLLSQLRKLEKIDG